MGSRRAVAHLWVLAESLGILGPWLELADASVDNGCLSMAEPVYIRAKRQLVVAFVAPQGPPGGQRAVGCLLAGSAHTPRRPLTLGGERFVLPTC